MKNTKKIVIKFCSILVYVLILLYCIGFDVLEVFSVRDILIVIAGTIILTIPHYIGMKDKRKVLSTIGWNSMVASYICTFVLLFTMLSKQSELDSLMKNIALACRPILYGFIIYVLAKTNNKEDNGVDKEENINTKHSSKEQFVLSEQEIYFSCRNIGLTQRESEIAKYVIKGLSNGEIAEQLYIAESTVKKHMSHIFEKLNISSRDELKKILYKND